MTWYKSVVEKSLFTLIFVLITAIGLANLLGISNNQILETIVNAVISTLIALIITILIFKSHERRITKGVKG